MPVELRKRKAPASAPAPAPAAKKASGKPASKAAAPAKDSKPIAHGPNGDATPASKKPVVGDTIALRGFGSEVETNDGAKVTLEQLVDESKRGVVLFTYPKASTPGCTTQACLFRDSYTPLTATGFSIYGLSTDSPKANTTFKTKQNLPYPLLCDPSATLIEAIGLKKAPKGTTRGVFVVNKDGKVLAAEPGGPAATVDVVRKLTGGVPEKVGNMVEGEQVQKDLEGGSKSTGGDAKQNGAKVEVPSAEQTAKEDVAKANVAADVADTAQKLDGNAK